VISLLIDTTCVFIFYDAVSTIEPKCEYYPEWLEGRNIVGDYNFMVYISRNYLGIRLETLRKTTKIPR
jgi:hypothetical protein